MRLAFLAAAAIALAVPAQAREPQNERVPSLQAKDAKNLEISARRRKARRQRDRSFFGGFMRAAGVRASATAVPPPTAYQIDPRLPLAAAPIPERRARQAAAAARSSGPASSASFAPRAAPRSAVPAGLQASIARHAQANGIPESLVHRVIVRESRYNPRAVGRGGAMGLMQIKTATARGMGYAGSAQGLLDAETNLTYAVRYLAGAYRAAGGNADRAVSYYASGYYGRGTERRRR